MDFTDTLYILVVEKAWPFYYPCGNNTFLSLFCLSIIHDTPYRKDKIPSMFGSIIENNILRASHTIRKEKTKKSTRKSN